MTAMIEAFQAVLFDFDGTLADSYSAIASSVNHVRAKRDMAPLTVDEVKIHVGRAADYLLTQTVPGGNLAEDLACYRAHHPGVMLTHTHFLPGADTLLRSLHRAGKRIGLCSNKPRLFSQSLLRHLEVEAIFEVVLGPEDVPLPKPAPDMLLCAMQKLKLNAEQVLYVGDMIVDIQTARAAGVQVWVVPTGCEERGVLEKAKPDRVLVNLQEMVAEVRPM